MAHVKKIICIIILLAAANRLPAQYDTVLKRPFPQQYRAMDSIMEILVKKDSVTASHIIEQIAATARNARDELILLNFKRSLLNYYYLRYRASGDSIVLNGLAKDSKNFLATINEKKYPELTAMIHVDLGLFYYYQTNKYNLAFSHYKKAYNLLKNISSEKFPERQYSQYTIARAYYQFSDFESAIALGKENESIYPVKNYISVFNIHMIGLGYLNLKMYDSALACFQWVLDNNKLCLNMPAWKGIALGSIGNVYFFTNQYDKAIPYLDSGINYTIQTRIPDNTAVFAAHLSTIYLTKGNVPLAKKYVEIAYQSVFQFKVHANEITGYQWLLNHLLVYQSLSDYYKKTGNIKLAFIYLDSVVLVKDSLTRWHDVNLKYQGELAVEKERVSQNERLFDEEEVKNKLVRNGLIGFIILAMLVTLLVYNRGRLQIQHREQQLIAEKQLTEAELKNAVVQLNEFTKSILEKNELIEKVTMKMEQLGEDYQQLQDKQSTSPPPVLNEDSLKLLRESVLLTDDDWKNFTDLFDKVHKGFFFRLKEKLPTLSPAETRFVALSKLKLSNKEMAAILGISTDAIRQSRSRLKKKLDLSDDTGIEQAVEKI